jgi:hypothetical protein
MLRHRFSMALPSLPYARGADDNPNGNTFHLYTRPAHWKHSSLRIQHVTRLH